MLSVKQGGIKYHFLSLWYDSTWDWTQVSRAIGEHSNPEANVRFKNAACNPEQVLAATPHKTPTVRPPAPYHENYSS